ncbi:MAG: FAD-binding oxidoreductase, partial [Hydrogenophaga sp.]|uniref:FAD-binding oxidoreductase n=1 Tax=Hydrogenophaga sp. TaxID=1904254 RepID=UPI002A36079C
ADIEDEPDAQVIPVRDFAASIARIETLTPTITAFFLELDKPMHFQAGQYVQLEIPGLGESRAFSIANTPADVAASRTIEINVRRVPGGRGTTWLHEQARAGDRVRLAGPYGRFFVRKSSPLPLLFMAGGSGLSSPRSMILELLAEGCTTPITLVYGQRTRTELYYDAEFRALAERHPNFRYVPALSEPAEDDDWSGERGFVHEAARALFPQGFAGHKAYLCGPPPMVEACIATLMQGRLFERDIYTEKFLSAADAQGARSPLFRRV